MDLIRYRVGKTSGGLTYCEWRGVEFVRRVAALIPPARKHVVRYWSMRKTGGDRLVTTS